MATSRAAAAARAEIIERIDTFARRRLDETKLPSVVLALVDRDGVIFSGAYGYANLESRTPPTDHTLYETGSIGKSFTTVALLQLKDEGKIDLAAPVSDYLPWFKPPSSFGPITIHHLLSHTAGISSGTDFAPDPRFEVWAAREYEPAWAPGERFHYSNLAFKALGLILERVTGQSYSEIIQQRVLDPLGMTESVAAFTNDTRPRMATGYGYLHDDRPGYPDEPLVPATWFQSNTGDGCLASSVIDLATYLRMYLNGGAAGVLTEENYRRMTARVIPIDRDAEEPKNFYGYGLFTRIVDGHVLIGHSGGMVGYYSDMIGDPEAGVGAVAMINGPGVDPAVFTDYALKLLQAGVLGQPLPEFPPPAGEVEPSTYAGVYTGSSGTCRIETQSSGRQLRLVVDGEQADLTPDPHGQPDTFIVRHHDLGRYLLSFRRNAEGEVAEVLHGNDWYTNDRYDGPSQFDYPAEWDSYVGHYRSHNPWQGSVRIVSRKGRLWLAHPNGFEMLLRQRSEGYFVARSGEGDDAVDLPEWLRFDTIVEGEALRLTLSGNAFYRFFTP